jgi:hypothetical protein
MAFIEQISYSIWVYVSILVGCFVAYTLILSKRVRNIFDPLFFILNFTNSICTANVLFMFYSKNIRLEYFVNYLMTEIAFIGGFLIFSGGRKLNFLGGTTVRYRYDKDTAINVLMYLSFALTLIPTLTLYAVSGIPLFLTSRYDSTIGGSGLGLLQRISSSASVMSLIAFFLKYADSAKRKRKVDILLFVISIVLGFLSGYKAFFLTYLNIYYLIHQEQVDKKGSILSAKTIGIGLAGTAIILGLFMIILKTRNLGYAAANLVYRIVASGDVYYMAYGKSALDQFPKVGFWHQLFGSTLASFRIIGWDEAPKNLGMVLNQVVNKSFINAGPTFRYNVLWLYLAGFSLSVFLSFFTGAFIGLIEKISRSFKHRSICYISVLLFYIKSFQFILGPDQGINESFFTVIYIISALCVTEIASALIEGAKGASARHEIRNRDGA